MTVQDLIKTLTAYYPKDAVVLIPFFQNPNENEYPLAPVGTIIFDEKRNTVELMSD